MAENNNDAFQKEELHIEKIPEEPTPAAENPAEAPLKSQGGKRILLSVLAVFLTLALIAGAAVLLFPPQSKEKNDVLLTYDTVSKTADGQYVLENGSVVPPEAVSRTADGSMVVAEAVSGAGESRSSQTPTGTQEETTKGDDIVPVTSGTQDAVSRPAGSIAPTKSTAPEKSTAVSAPVSTAPAPGNMEKLRAAIEKLTNASAAKSVMTGKTMASIVEQSTDSTHVFVRSGGKVNSYAYNKSSSKLLSLEDTVRGNGSSYTVTDSKGGKTTYSKSDYLAKRGPLPETLIPFEINSNTLAAGSKITATAKGSSTVYAMTLDVDKAAKHYKIALSCNAAAGGATFKILKEIQVKLTVNAKGELTAMHSHEVYDMEKTLLFVPTTVTCTSDFDYTFQTGSGISLPA